MNKKTIYTITRLIMKPLILAVDYLQNNFTEHFTLMNVGTTEHKSYKDLIKKFFLKKDFILDCGCGVGHFCTLFNKKKYIGIEINNNFVKIAKQRNKKYLFDNFKGSLIKNYKKKINAVLINNVIHHLAKKEVKKIFFYIKKNTKKNAKILIIEPILPINFFSIEFLLKVMDIGNYINDKKGYLKILEKYIKINKTLGMKFESNSFFKSSTLIINGNLK